MINQVSPTVNLLTTNRCGYLSHLLHQGKQPPVSFSWLSDLRDRYSAMVQELEIPSIRDEEWRFADLSPLLKLSFEAADFSEVSEAAISEFILPEALQSRLVFVNGIYAPSLSAVAQLPAGVFVGNLAELPQAYGDRIGNYLAKIQGNQEVFTALNTAVLTDVAVVWIPKNVVVEAPIHLLFITASESSVIIQPRCLVIAEANSSVTFLEDYTSLAADLTTDFEADVTDSLLVSVTDKSKSSAASLINAVTEVWVEENAQVNHTRIQRENGTEFHIGKSAIAQARNSGYTCNAVSLGAKFSRHNLEVFQTGEATETTLYGLTMIAQEQLSDTHSLIALNHPHGTTNQLHKCIVGDHAHAVFNGKVFVPKPAQLTDAGQLSRNLLLSPKARVDTKPQLEITADNVKCSHGATVSQLEDDEVFYLQSRGIDAENSRKLLINAFANEIIEKIPVTSMREKLAIMVKR